MDFIRCCNFIFYNKFDSANLARVDLVPCEENNPNSQNIVASTSSKSNHAPPEVPDIEFNLWTKPDCYGTEFENGNRTWFYFGVQAAAPHMLVKFNLVDINKQAKMYAQGMAPVYRVVPGKLQWERIRDKPAHFTEGEIFIVSFKYRTPDNPDSVTYFAFTYPFSYADCVKMLYTINTRFQMFSNNAALSNVPRCDNDDIYYVHEVLCHSLQGREVSLLTISSYHGITCEREDRLLNLFPNAKMQRPFKFADWKKVIFISARVHPGETPSTYVFNGLLQLLLSKDDPIAVTLRRFYVFKMIPILNPDGVALGHYRTDSRGVNLNRMYLNPAFALHPAIYAARALIRYHHQFYNEIPDEIDYSNTDGTDGHNQISSKVSSMTLQDESAADLSDDAPTLMAASSKGRKRGRRRRASSGAGGAGGIGSAVIDEHEADNDNDEEEELGSWAESGLFLYLDMHGHASKKGIFMYGNHFKDDDMNVECMLLPKIMSLNNHNFHFTSCNFTERNMYLRDKRDGMSREGSGRVAVLKLTKIIKSYTLECNYNTGRIVNVLPPTVKEPYQKMHTLLVPPKYGPHVFEEVGRSLGASILDLTGHNPFSRIPNSEFHSLTGIRDWLSISCVNLFENTRRIPFRLKSAGAGAVNRTGGRNSHANPDRPQHPQIASDIATAFVTSLSGKGLKRRTKSLVSKKIAAKTKPGSHQTGTSAAIKLSRRPATTSSPADAHLRKSRKLKKHIIRTATASVVTAVGNNTARHHRNKAFHLMKASSAPANARKSVAVGTGDTTDGGTVSKIGAPAKLLKLAGNAVSLRGKAADGIRGNRASCTAGSADVCFVKTHEGRTVVPEANRKLLRDRNKDAVAAGSSISPTENDEDVASINVRKTVLTIGSRRRPVSVFGGGGGASGVGAGAGNSTAALVGGTYLTRGNRLALRRLVAGGSGDGPSPKVSVDRSKPRVVVSTTGGTKKKRLRILKKMQVRTK